LAEDLFPHGCGLEIIGPAYDETGDHDFQAFVLKHQAMLMLAKFCDVKKKSRIISGGREGERVFGIGYGIFGKNDTVIGGGGDGETQCVSYGGHILQFFPFLEERSYGAIRQELRGDAIRDVKITFNVLEQKGNAAMARQIMKVRGPYQCIGAPLFLGHPWKNGDVAEVLDHKAPQ
jgi:hypothetical protein